MYAPNDLDGMPFLQFCTRKQLPVSNNWNKKRWDAIARHPSAGAKTVYLVIGLAVWLFDDLQFTQLFLWYHPVHPPARFIVFLQHEIQFTDLSG
jgi:hypothetical protein